MLNTRTPNATIMNPTQLTQATMGMPPITSDSRTATVSTSDSKASKFWTVFLLSLFLGVFGVLLDGCANSDGKAGLSSTAQRATQQPTAKELSPSETKLVGVYQLSNPAWKLQLKFNGTYVLQAVTGDVYNGTWSGNGTHGILSGTYPSKAAMSISFPSDGSIVIDRYGYRFMRID